MKKCLLFLIIAIQTKLIWAHEIRPAYLEITQTTDTTYQVFWKVPIVGNRTPKIDPILPNGFTLTQTREKFLIDASLRTYIGDYKPALNGKTIAIQGLKTTLMDVLVQINLLDKTSYSFLLQANKPQTTIPIEPNRWQIVKLYLLLGIEHILIGIDHLLFVLGLLLLVKGIKVLIQTVTAFTLAHSTTLALAALDLVHIPQAPVEAVIALSIVFLAREYLMIEKGKKSFTAQHPWLVAFIFGLLHGFGFSAALQEIGLPQKEIPMALFSFNVGVEIGQLIFIAAILSLIYAIKRLSLQLPLWSRKIVPYVMGGVAAFWLIERVMRF